MNTAMRNAAPVKPHSEGPPRLNSTGCAPYVSAARASGQSSSGVARNPEGQRMSQELVKRAEQFSLIEQVVIGGDLSKLSPEQRVTYYNYVCQSAGLNPATRPLAYLSLNGKLVLYATKDCTEQLRKINGVSIEGLDARIIDDLYVVKARARDKSGRFDESTGAVSLGSLKGEQKANAIMKAETKAKRRVTLSICGMGWVDDAEVDTIPGAQRIEVDITTGEIKGNEEKPKETPPPAPRPITAEQIAELEMIMGECDAPFQVWVKNAMSANYNASKLSDLPAEAFERLKSICLKKMEETHAQQRAAAVLPDLTPEEPDFLAAEVR